MKMKKILLNRGAWTLLFLIAALYAPAPSAGEKTVLFSENFATLDNWREQSFPKIEKHSVYTIEKEDGHHVLRAESHASASAIVYKDVFNVYDYPKARWRWKVMNVYAKGDPRTKEGDDYPLRILIMFEYDPGTAGAFEKMKYGMVKKLQGEYPPQCMLCYVWASREGPETVFASPYTEKTMTILLEKGPNKVGTWQEEEVDIMADYQKVFGTRPPVRARIAIMNDSDNTGESAVSFIEYLEVFR